MCADGRLQHRHGEELEDAADAEEDAQHEHVRVVEAVVHAQREQRDERGEQTDPVAVHVVGGIRMLCQCQCRRVPEEMRFEVGVFAREQ